MRRLVDGVFPAMQGLPSKKLQLVARRYNCTQLVARRYNKPPA